MRIERAIKFGLIAAVGVAVISLTTGWLFWQQYTASVDLTGEPATGILLVIWLAGLVVNLLYLFVVIGEYVDRMLDERGVAGET